MRINRYAIPTSSIDPVENLVSMPLGARVLGVTAQTLPYGRVRKEAVVIHAMVDPEEGSVMRRFVIAGPGHELPQSIAIGEFVGSVVMRDGELVFHVFEVP